MLESVLKIALCYRHPLSFVSILDLKPPTDRINKEPEEKELIYSFVSCFSLFFYFLSWVPLLRSIGWNASFRASVSDSHRKSNNTEESNIFIDTCPKMIHSQIFVLGEFVEIEEQLIALPWQLMTTMMNSSTQLLPPHHRFFIVAKSPLLQLV